jgi:hypothetical protein
MGLWATGYLEFHEPSDLEGIPLVPIPLRRYQCSDCDRNFTDVQGLNEHRFIAHPTRAPFLIINGRILDDRPVHITQTLAAIDIDLRNVTSCSVNGLSISIAEFTKRLINERNQTLDIVIRNGVVTKMHQLIISISDPDHINGVERALIDSAFDGKLTHQAIASFRSATDRFTGAKRYQHGICQYLYGVLAKDRSPESGLPYGRYLEKFNDATEALGDFETPLARVVTAAVAFHQNRFATARDLVPTLHLGKSADRFCRLLDGETPSFGDFTSTPTDDVISSLLIDSDTEQVITMGLLSAQQAADYANDLQKLYLACSNSLDKTKFAILAVEALHALGDAESVRIASDICKRYRHDVDIGRWAESRRRG